jgi:predicted dehydrogenase
MEVTRTSPTRSCGDQVAPGMAGGDHVPSRGSSAARRWPTVVPAHSLRVGVVGCGYWGAKHVRVLSGMSDVDEVALIEPDPDGRGALAAAFPSASTYASLAAALPHIDAVVIATPPATHTDLALQALRGGKHVLVEKPLATSAAQARRIVGEARLANRVLMVGHTFEFSAAVQALRRHVEQLDFGDVRYIHSSRFNIDLYRSDVNVIWDLAPHDISIMNYVLRSTPTAVTAWGGSGGHVDVAYMRLDYGRIGVTGYVHVSWLEPKKTRQVTVVGRNKVATYNDLDAEARVRIFERTAAPAAACAGEPGSPPAYRYGPGTAPAIDFREPLAVEDQHFVDCIRSRTPPEVDGCNGLAVVATLEAVERSLATGGPVAPELVEPPVAHAATGALQIAGARS